MEVMMEVVQIVITALLAGWLTIGVRDNILHPEINEQYTAEVLSMARLERDYPDEFARMSQRALTNRVTQRLLFRLIVITEALVAGALWIGVVGLLMGLAETGSAEVGQMIAVGAALGFTTLWGMFLIVGNYFCYWFCHVEAQATHFFMLLWGLATLIVLLLP